MSNALKIAAYLIGTLVVGALLTPPLYWAGHAAGSAWKPLHALTTFEFRRYFDRAMLIAALLLLWPAVRMLHIGNWRDLGLAPDPRRWRHLGLGFALGAVGLWLMGVAMCGLDVYTLRPPGAIAWGSVPIFLLSAAVVSCLEESLFRGALQGLVGRTMSPVGAIVFVAVLFATLHFLRPPEGAVEPSEVGWLSGFEFIPKVFWQWADLRLVLGGLATLVAVGLILGYARLRTRGLWLGIGLHGGWVFALKSFSAATRHTAPSNLWAGEDLRHGIVPVAAVAATGLVVAWSLRREEQKPA